MATVKILVRVNWNLRSIFVCLEMLSDWKLCHSFEKRVIPIFLFLDHNFQEGFKYCLHIALVYCPTSEKQILFAVVITIWMLPIYTVIVFSGYIFMQFCRTISENFKQLRHDIGEKSRQVIFFLSNLGLVFVDRYIMEIYLRK